MSYQFKRLSEVEALTEVPEGAKVLAEANGKIVRVPGSGLGGGTGIKTAIIKSSDYDQALSGVQSYIEGKPEITYSCINMTFEEAYDALANGEPMTAHLMLGGNMAGNMHGSVFFLGTAGFNAPCIVLVVADGSEHFFWTSDGISTTEPGVAAP